jgi:hypothetical protein
MLPPKLQGDVVGVIWMRQRSPDACCAHCSLRLLPVAWSMTATRVRSRVRKNTTKQAEHSNHEEKHQNALKDVIPALFKNAKIEP